MIQPDHGNDAIVMFAGRNIRAARGEHLLGERARWGRVGYAGKAFAPAQETYRGINAMRLRLTSIADSGRAPEREGLVNLYPLVAAALYEMAFAREAGPLATWRN
jgi:hypothetical protein